MEFFLSGSMVAGYEVRQQMEVRESMTKEEKRADVG